MAAIDIGKNIREHGVSNDSAGVQHTSVANYLFRRLHDLGARAVHGVEGEHNRVVLEYIEPAGMKWVEHYSELSAGYAADGYARIKGVSVLITTFGSGEIVALNAISQANAEFVPIVHIVGMPSTSSQHNDGPFHYPLGSGNHCAFADLHRPFSVVCAILDKPTEAASQIDHALRECWIQSRPVYLGLPSDMAHQPVESDRLQVPIELRPSPDDHSKESYVADVILRYLNAASDPVILVDVGVIRHRSQQEVRDLMVKSNVPTFVSPMAKGVIDETLPNYCGVYAGSASEPGVRERVESADLVLSIGALRRDFVNQSGMVYLTSGLPTIYLYGDRVCVRYSEYHGVRMTSLLRRVADELRPPSLKAQPISNTSHLFPPRNTSLQTYHDAITHLWFWRILARWLQPQDILIANTDIPAFGLCGIRYSCRITSIIPTLWRSVGYGIPACRGAVLAVSESATALSPHSTSTSGRSKSRYPRIILFTTPDELQNSGSEISNLLRQRLKPIIIVLCPAGKLSQVKSASTTDCPYDDSLFPPPLKQGIRTDVEHGLRSGPKHFHLPSNTLSRSTTCSGQKWRYHDLLSSLKAQEGACRFSSAVRTRERLTSIFEDESFNDCSTLRVVEVEFSVPGDAPAALRRVRKAYSSSNRWTVRPGGT